MNRYTVRCSYEQTDYVGELLQGKCVAIANAINLVIRYCEFDDEFAVVLVLSVPGLSVKKLDKEFDHYIGFRIATKVTND